MTLNQRYLRIRRRGYRWGEDARFWFFHSRHPNAVGWPVETGRRLSRLMSKFPEGHYIIGDLSKKPMAPPNACLTVSNISIV